MGQVLHVDEDLRRDATSFHRSLTDLVRAVQSRDRRSVGFHDVSVTQCHALDALSRAGSITLGDLSRELFLDKSTTSRVVDSLVRKGYANRVKDGSDARVRRISVTPRGQDLHQRIEHERFRGQLELIADLEPECRRQMTGLIEQLARAAAAGLVTPRLS